MSPFVWLPGIQDPSLYMAVKLAAHVTFDKRGGKKSHAHTFLSFFIYFGWTVKLLSFTLICPQSLQTSLTGVYVKMTCSCASDKFNVGVPPSLSVSVYPPRGRQKTDTLRWRVGGEGGFN